MTEQPFETAVDVARDKAARLGEKLAYVNLKDGREHWHLSYRQLDDSCRRIGAALQRRNASGERILLLFPQGAEFVTGFFGCLYGGVIAVPAHTPKPNKRSWTTFEAIVADCRPRFILTCRSIRDNIEAWLKPYPLIRSLEVLCVEDLEAEGAADQWTPSAPTTDIAFLQYTSGSTSAPKGVVVSHSNLMHNAALTARHLGHDEETVIVSWLPLFHDLGLIGIVFQTLFVGATCYMMSPAAFSGNPALWLQAISRYRASTTMSSDFGYRLCVKSIRPEQLEGVDLRCWRNALNAAEPIHAATLRSFSERFSAYGFSEDAFLPAYGLAEATLLSTTSRVGERPVILSVAKDALSKGQLVPVHGENRDAVVEIVSSGRPSHDMDVEIVDPETRLQCEDGSIGEVWVRGGSVAQGYWEAPEATGRVFRQSLAGKEQPEFLRTGDLGFRWRDELFIAGRLKDLIISRGRNIYPQDLELTVKDCHPAFRTVNGAAFSIERDGEESIVIVHEVERTERNGTDLTQLEKVVRHAVWRDHDVRLADVVFIRPASLPKTTSGKVQRRSTKSLYLSDELNLLRPREPGPQSTSQTCDREAASSRTRSSVGDMETLVLAKAGALAGVPVNSICADDSFGTIGIDSVLSAQLAATLSQELGLALEPTIFWQYPTPSALARRLAPSSRTQEPSRSPVEAPRSRADLVSALKLALRSSDAQVRG